MITSTASPSSPSSSSPALAALIAARCRRRLPLPVVVIEIVLGIVVGPELLGLAEPDDFLEFFSSLGLGMLFFFAGYEIDFERIRGSPLRLAALGWVLSLAIAYALGGLLELSGLVLSLVFTGSAMATTAIGTLIPILSDAGELRTRFGTYLLAAGAIGRVRADPADHAGVLDQGRGVERASSCSPSSRWRWSRRWWPCAASAAAGARSSARSRRAASWPSGSRWSRSSRSARWRRRSGSTCCWEASWRA